MDEQQPSQLNNLLILAIILMLVGDVFFFGALFFRDFILEYLMFFSPEFGVAELNNAGESVALFYMATLGSLLYLVAFLVWGISKPALVERKTFALYGLVTWFVADSIGSLVFSFGLNILSNVLFLAVGVIFLRFLKE